LERGVYFDGWFPRQHCYHPSLPPRRLRMIEDLEDYRATMLVWSALGGGSISLPYLEQEAWQDIDPRMRFYGFLNDAEFIEHCQERGIKVFGIVFEVQGWEFPVELDDAEDTVLSMNEPRGVGTRGWLGLREFTQNRYPKLWKPFEDYFPDGLVNSEGEPVTDLLEECVSRDIYGEPCHAQWVEAPDRDHFAYLMDRNNPVWREYLKAIIRIQIDAGVAGVQLDEADYPMWAIADGGCFCKDCVKQFRAYLQELPSDELPEELEGTDLQRFHYGSWLLERGFDFKDKREQTPLFWEWMRFQRRMIAGYFGELADYIKEYGRSKDRDVLVSGNLFYLSPHFYPFEPKADVLITEMNKTSYRQPVWCRYAAGFAQGKPVIVVENPFGGVGPQLLPELQRGRWYDRFRIMQFEAAALGIEDSFWAPRDVIVEVQDFIADHDRLYASETFNEVALLASTRSMHDWLEAHGFGELHPFWAAGEAMVGAHQPFDVVLLPDGDLRADTITPDALARYRTIVLPECSFLTGAQADAIGGHLERGGFAIALGHLGTNLSDPLEHPHLRRADALRVDDLRGGPQVQVSPSVDMAINLHRVSDREAAIHVIRYDFDEDLDRVPMLDRMELDVRLPRPFWSIEALSPTGDTTAGITGARGGQRIHLEHIGVYTVISLR
jgi:hypothetical protein